MKLIRTLFFVALAALVLTNCRKDEKFTEDSGVRLDFSMDTVMFDTLFTTVNSITKRFTVHNPNANAVRVDIALEGGVPSPFRINVDGATGTSFQDIEIYGGDSFYIFVETNVDQTNTANPFVMEDHILFNTNGTQQSVLLVVWGQNAHFFYPGPDSVQVQGLPRFSYIAGGYDENGIQICEDVVWPNDLPYVIYGYAVVDECCKLTIDPGVQVYFHGGGGLWVYRNGQITVGDQFSVDQPVVFQGDRLQPFYDEVPGQWDRIWINEGPGSYDNTFDNVVIKNALVGIQCETWPFAPEEPTSATKLKLHNVRIRNCSAAGILSRNYKIDADNLLVGDCGQYGVVLTGGGEYNFDHFTLANFWSFEIRQTPTFYMTNGFVDINNALQIRPITASRFFNGIVHGSNENEFQLEFDTNGSLDLRVDHMLLKTNQSTSDPNFFPIQGSILRNQSPEFLDVINRDFHITSNSAAKNRATTSEVFFDLDGVARGQDGQPDLGCFEATE